MRRNDLRALRCMIAWTRRAIIALIVLALALAASILPYRAALPALAVDRAAEGEARLHFLSVGQGDCTLVEFPSGSVVAIDGGDGTFANNDYVVRYLKALAPASLTLIATHADVDHFGGLTELLRVFRVDRVLLPPVSAETSAYTRFLEAVEEEGCAVDTIARYEAILDRSGAYLACLSPHAAEETDENESAAVLYFAYGDFNALLASDIDSAREEALCAEYAALPSVFDCGALRVDLEDVDLLKAAHHGSANASCETWLSLLSPDAAVISCGAGNAYGHPSQAALRRLYDAGAEIYRTDARGTVVAASTGRGYSVVCAR